MPYPAKFFATSIEGAVMKTTECTPDVLIVHKRRVLYPKTRTLVINCETKTMKSDCFQTKKHNTSCCFRCETFD